MKKIAFFALPMLLASCNSRYATVPLNKIPAERKHVAQNFAETLLSKCEKQDYSEFRNFNISKSFQRELVEDSLEAMCKRIVRRNGKITLEKLVSAHTPTSPRDFIDVYNFKLKAEKSATPVYLHLGMYRDQNFIEKPLYFSRDENYYETIRKKYYKK
ncbi:hypothetical protein [Kaistella palustris]|uniref:hypothetical protein n=1 Tax=Kaistella palustris TaxID=493376 RepID=UPI0004020E9E|nr:hypothetical protein [Kaistella palustris]